MLDRGVMDKLSRYLPRTYYLLPTTTFSDTSASTAVHESAEAEPGLSRIAIPTNVVFVSSVACLGRVGGIPTPSRAPPDSLRARERQKDLLIAVCLPACLPMTTPQIKFVHPAQVHIPESNQEVGTRHCRALHRLLCGVRREGRGDRSGHRTIAVIFSNVRLPRNQASGHRNRRSIQR
ncbi:hypothetical protein BO94DRAFT_131605 [Aspergillus sclerotioniger CBS 115572]|uniref:Uncharacterized protein n=1 Tax=Aspergillus sclerotioniger CBS 115572 TaxID=1450535 RepID=A0A317XAL1_9EURO|nr:hypothetical protein BO94DRAFT_131605 [Aspergillus sclerotioniger CBS 115572]PWY95624.1 hypothetical protein BO94DRAFT_131605 [Aspergillus sclerotioniger CBS 115572]